MEKKLKDKILADVDDGIYNLKKKIQLKYKLSKTKARDYLFFTSSYVKFSREMVEEIKWNMIF